ncbi:DNA glycosylase AlkZ-like family protein [Natronorubrum sp. FCH18a]|uniref:DNA glycosylase AlkZ-like family protein n=1 Tax=Natronorubrum sp. FCH18a TaxID=3447018 RepID=UPI003F51916D
MISAEYRQRFVDGRVRKGSVLLDGFFDGFWSVQRDHDATTLLIEPFEPLSGGTRTALSDEGTRFLTFAAAEADSREIRFADPC